MVADGATFPMCTVKNRLQVAGAAASKAAGRPAYSGATDCLVTIVRAGGPTCPSPLLYPSPLRLPAARRAPPPAPAGAHGGLASAVPRRQHSAAGGAGAGAVHGGLSGADGSGRAPFTVTPAAAPAVRPRLVCAPRRGAAAGKDARARGMPAAGAGLSPGGRGQRT